MGVLLTRGQVFTIAHLGLVKLILQENDYACIVIGSADKKGTLRNPLDIDVRMLLVKGALSDLGKDKDRVSVFGLNDWLNENNKDNLKQWGHYLYYNIVGNTSHKRFSLYYSDGEDILNSWFDDEVRPYITYVCNDRKELFDGISATKVRELLVEGKEDEAKEFIPHGEWLLIPGLTKALKQVYERNDDRE